MKKPFFVFCVILIAGIVPVFADETNIIDYYPCEVGYSWEYANSSGQITDIYMLMNKMPDPMANDGSFVYLMQEQMIRLGSTSTMFTIRENKMQILMTKNIMGQYLERNPPLIILVPENQEWHYNDRGDEMVYATKKSSCVVDDKVYDDCILVEEKIMAGNTVLRMKKSYYAKGIGLVLVTLQSGNAKESVYIKLVKTSF